MIEGLVELAEKVCLGLYRLMKRAYLYVRFSGRISLGSVSFRRPFYCRVGPRGRIAVGRGTFVNYSAKIIAFDTISIGRRCLIGPNVGIYDFDHRHELDGTPFGSQGMETAPVEIGDNVWIGANAVILKGTRVGSNTVIGAGAVVSGDIPPCSLVYDRKDAIVSARKVKTTIK